MMSLFWAVPPVAVSVAVAIALTQLRDITAASEDLVAQIRRLDDVRVAVDGVRAESARARASLRGLRTR